MQRRGIGEKIHHKFVIASSVFPAHSTYDHVIGGSAEKYFAIASSVFPARSTYDHVIGGDIWDHILSYIFVVKKVTSIGTVRQPESYKKYRNHTI